MPKSSTATPSPNNCAPKLPAAPTALTARGVTPGLAVVLVGDNPASAGVCAQQGQGLRRTRACTSVLEQVPATLREAALLARIEALEHATRRIHGILVQLPLPGHIDAHKVIEAISPAKDVDGFHRAAPAR